MPHPKIDAIGAQSWIPKRRDFLLPEPILADSERHIDLGDAPDLGVEVDWAALERLRIA